MIFDIYDVSPGHILSSSGAIGYTAIIKGSFKHDIVVITNLLYYLYNFFSNFIQENTRIFCVLTKIDSKINNCKCKTQLHWFLRQQMTQQQRKQQRKQQKNQQKKQKKKQQSQQQQSQQQQQSHQQQSQQQQQQSQQQNQDNINQLEKNITTAVSHTVNPKIKNITFNISTERLKNALFNATVNFILFDLRGTIFGGAVRDYFIRGEDAKDIDVYVKYVDDSIELFKKKFNNSIFNVTLSNMKKYNTYLTTTVTITINPFLCLFPEMEQLSMPSLSVDLVKIQNSNIRHDFDVNLFSVSILPQYIDAYTYYQTKSFHTEPLWVNNIEITYRGDPGKMCTAYDNIKKKHFNHILHYIQYPIPNNGQTLDKRIESFLHIIKIASRTVNKINEGWTTDISNCPFLNKNKLHKACPICFDIHQYFMILPCSHNLCVECLYKHVNDKINFKQKTCNNVKIQCPICRYELIETSSNENKTKEEVSGSRNENEHEIRGGSTSDSDSYSDSDDDYCDFYRDGRWGR